MSKENPESEFPRKGDAQPPSRSAKDAAQDSHLGSGNAGEGSALRPDRGSRPARPEGNKTFRPGPRPRGASRPSGRHTPQDAPEGRRFAQGQKPRKHEGDREGHEGRETDNVPSTKKTKKQRPWYVEIPIIIVAAIIITSAFQAIVGRVYVIPSESMEPTLHGCTNCNNDRIFVNKMVYRFSDPHPGDVVVFRGPDSWGEGVVTRRSSNGLARGLQNLGSYMGLVAPDENDLVKRIIATGGQTVECLPGDDGVKVDGKTIDSSYILQPPQRAVDLNSGSVACGGNYFGPVKVPEGNVWVMGDNRTNSADSRFHMGDEYQGTVPESNIIGRVESRILPINRIGGVGHPDIQG